MIRKLIKWYFGLLWKIDTCLIKRMEESIMIRTVIKSYFSLSRKIDTCLNECMEEVMKENESEEE